MAKKERRANRDRIFKLAQKVRQLISKSKNWKQGCEASDLSGQRVDPQKKTAISFCLQGAIFHCSSRYSNTARTLLKVLEEHIAQNPIRNWGQHYPAELRVAEFNDLSSHRSVLKLLDRVIDTLRVQTK